MASTTVSTDIPSTITTEQMLTALHNHELMIKTLCPGLISYEFESGDKESEATYSVTDKKPIGQTTFKLTLTNVPDGVDSLVNANPPVGILVIAGKWRVNGGKLVEDVEIEGNFMMKKMAKSNVEKTHPQQHSLLIEQVAKA
ncbi:hypothetical protein K504DRAFT_534758 [Pleomassaria siparia CBS 279.74]|uniref:DUF7053 domain-containing protein n=1 Tax=Pleomassaria siparia CBS 279.74 TaxID=1314801 RepID=A0A6G1K638_9PLEO|nr:hypothetical protein K504DRAFT_534758 [Pleomassaria siparia CBS 279.74]